MEELRKMAHYAYECGLESKYLIIWKARIAEYQLESMNLMCI